MNDWATGWEAIVELLHVRTVVSTLGPAVQNQIAGGFPSRMDAALIGEEPLFMIGADVLDGVRDNV